MRIDLPHETRAGQVRQAFLPTLWRLQQARIGLLQHQQGSRPSTHPRHHSSFGVCGHVGGGARTGEHTGAAAWGNAHIVTRSCKMIAMLVASTNRSSNDDAATNSNNNQYEEVHRKQPKRNAKK